MVTWRTDSTNILDRYILAKLAARPQPAEATEPARFALYNIDLSGGRIDFLGRDPILPSVFRIASAAGIGLAAGLTNAKIGETLFISATTAKFHVSNIMRKLEVSRRAEAVYAASKRGLI